jgi:hypothetical protein
MDDEKSIRQEATDVRVKNDEQRGQTRPLLGDGAVLGHVLNSVAFSSYARSMALADNEFTIGEKSIPGP